jgi:hypothetical protein
MRRRTAAAATSCGALESLRLGGRDNALLVRLCAPHSAALSRNPLTRPVRRRAVCAPLRCAA